jgi:ComF family protein
MFSLPKTIGTALLDTLYPHLCPGCHYKIPSAHQALCITCEANLPLSYDHTFSPNPLEKIFWGRLPLQKAISLMVFSKDGLGRRMIHEVKYQGNTALGYYLGAKLGQLIINEPFIKEMDGIVPMPLHPKKKRIRGYNQCDIIGKGLSDTLSIPLLSNVVCRVKNNPTQTKVNREGRWGNVTDAFKLSEPEMVYQKNILLLDDTVTTGATIESLGKAILNETSCRLYLASIACAQI